MVSDAEKLKFVDDIQEARARATTQATICTEHSLSIVNGYGEQLPDTCPLRLESAAGQIGLSACGVYKDCEKALVEARDALDDYAASITQGIAEVTETRH